MMLATDRDFIEEVLARRVRMGFGPMRPLPALPPAPEPPPPPPPPFPVIISRAPRRVSIRDVLGYVAEHYGISTIDIISARRTASIVMPRQIGMYLSTKLTTRSLPEIGRVFGGKDHTTIIHARKKINALIALNADFAAELESLAAAIIAQHANASGRKTGFHERRGSA